MPIQLGDSGQANFNIPAPHPVQQQRPIQNLAPQGGGGGGGGGVDPNALIYQNEAAQAQISQRAQAQAWLNQQEMTQQDQMRLQQLNNSVSQVMGSDILTDEEKQRAVLQLRTHIDPMQLRAQQQRQQQQQLLLDQATHEHAQQVAFDQTSLPARLIGRDGSNNITPDNPAIALQSGPGKIHNLPPDQRVARQERDATAREARLTSFWNTALQHGETQTTRELERWHRNLPEGSEQTHEWETNPASLRAAIEERARNHYQSLLNRPDQVAQRAPVQPVSRGGPNLQGGPQQEQGVPIPTWQRPEERRAFDAIVARIPQLAPPASHPRPVTPIAEEQRNARDIREHRGGYYAPLGR
jgi:hypothetical protein